MPALPLTPEVCLFVLVPTAVEDRLVDWLISHADWQIEFSVHPVAARGPLVHMSASDELVQGFARRVEFKLIVRRERIAALVQAVDALLAGVDGGYWVMPVERFASFRSTP